MVSPYLKFKSRRIGRRIRKSSMFPFRWTSKFVEKTILKRWKKFRDARRFIFTWMGLALVLVIAVSVQIVLQNRTVKVSVAKEGGRYVEAVVGDLTNMNPLFSIDGANADATKLLFSSLVEYGANGQLTGDLAETWKANKTATQFTVVLKEDLKWHDGQPLTAQDVVFTLGLIQDPNVRSPHFDTWQGVKVEAKDSRTLVFDLPNPFVPFPHLLRFGILPEHILREVDPASLRAIEYNKHPMGSGPFKYLRFDSNANSLLLAKNDDYHESPPKINRIELQFFDNLDNAQEALNERRVDGLGSDERITGVTDKTLAQYNPRTSSGTYVFFNTQRKPLNSKSVRQALTYGFDQGEYNRALIAALPDLNGPFFADQIDLGEKKYEQFGLDKKRAKEILAKDKWKQTESGILAKSGKSLSFTLAAPDTPQAHRIVNELTKQWQEIGVSVAAEYTDVSDYQTLVVLPHEFDAALVTVTNGLSPDVFVYWHSSQAVPGGLNFSQIKNSTIDAALEAGRTRIDTKLQRAKYKSFATEWRNLAPAVALHQGQFTYLQRPRVEGFKQRVLFVPSDRFYNVEQWSVLQQKVEIRDLE